MYKLEITVSARKDLEKIYEYIAFELKNLTAADDFLSKMEKCCDLLVGQPYMYEACRDERLRIDGYRRAVIKKYVMVYRVDDNNQRIYVLRFFYGSQDYEKMI